MSNFVALLRGVNVGGKNRLPMAELSRMFEDAGCSNVLTYIQSGNVRFSASQAKAAKVPRVISARIAERFGYRTPVILRTADELDETIRNNSFLLAGAPENHLHVLFLADQPEAAAVASLDPERSPPDAFEVRGREIYLRCPNGAGGTRLTNAWFDSRLATISTGRNWRTVLKLQELAKG